MKKSRQKKIDAYMTLQPAKLSQVKAGTKLVADDGFTCMGLGMVRTVQDDGRGELFVQCRSGRHSLDGQLSDEDGDTLVGLRFAPNA